MSEFPVSNNAVDPRVRDGQRSNSFMLPKFSTMHQRTALDPLTNMYKLRFNWHYEATFQVDRRMPDLIPNGAMVISDDIFNRLDHQIYGGVRRLLEGAMREIEREIQKALRSGEVWVTSDVTREGFNHLRDIINAQLTIKD